MTIWRGSVLFALFFALSACAGEPTHSRETAFIACQRFVKERLRAPASAQFPTEGLEVEVKGDVYTFRGAVDAQNGFGALIRGFYSCSVQWLAGEIYNLKEVNMAGDGF